MPLDDLERKIQMVMAQTQRLQSGGKLSAGPKVSPRTADDASAEEEEMDGCPSNYACPSKVQDEMNGHSEEEVSGLPPPPASETPPPRPPEAPRSEKNGSRMREPKLYERAAEIRGKLEARGRKANGLWDRLHADAAKRRVEREKQPRVDGTFAPEITTMARKSSGEARTPRTATLYAHARAVTDKLDEKRAAEARAPTGCTFRPEISRRARSASPARGPGTPVHERLMAAGAAREEAARAREAIEAKRRANECTFRPAILSQRRTGKAAAGGVAERSAQYERDKQRRLAALREAREALAVAEATFAPRINHARPPRRETDSDVWERLSNDNSVYERAARREDARRAEMERYTFRPRTNATTTKNSEAAASAHERLYVSSRELAARENERRERRETDELAGCTFRPAVNGSREASSSESWSRLLDDARDVAALRDELKRARELEGCTFAPLVGRSPGPRGRETTPAHERLARDDILSKHAERGRLRAERELEGCTFRPRTGRSPARDPGKPVVDRMLEDETARRARSVERQRRKEDDERREMRGRVSRREPSAERMEKLAAPRTADGARKRADLERQKLRDLDKRPRARSASPARSVDSEASTARPRRGRSPAPQRRQDAAKTRPSTRRSLDSPRRERDSAALAQPPPHPNHKPPRPPPSSSDHPPYEPSTTSPGPALDEFERWQAEMEAKLAAL
ncbi:hypothetical protein CTAYLR_002465 [Chrysophaeum taylorii]|uniref:Uncharacterized protein n=1 Tax=Chrysophaeum taylorii TaxID=2483200 RepID=A0AAD7ULV3_9STRA|nr:hypothetical protein CTAYLR_002465 [Chrysophaeum taylorii]